MFQRAHTHHPPSRPPQHTPLLLSFPAHKIIPKNTNESMAEPSSKKQKVLTQFDKLAAVTTIVADTGEIAQIKRFAPTDATTNPSLLYKASSAPEHQDLVNDALAYGKALEGVFACLGTAGGKRRSSQFGLFNVVLPTRRDRSDEPREVHACASVSLSPRPLTICLL